MTELTPSAINGQAAQTKAAAVKNTVLAKAGRTTSGPAAQGLYDPRNEHDACGVGFIANMKGVKSHGIVEDGLAMLENLTPRGAVGADPLVGDGAGVLVQIPDAFFREEMAAKGVELPPAGQYGVGHWFMPQDAALRAHIEEIIADQDGGDLVVTEFHVGIFAAFERLSASTIGIALLDVFGLRRREGLYRIPWDKLDISEPARPRLLCPDEELAAFKARPEGK